MTRHHEQTYKAKVRLGSLSSSFLIWKGQPFRKSAMRGQKLDWIAEVQVFILKRMAG